MHIQPDEPTFNVAWAEGSALMLEQAMMLALRSSSVDVDSA